ncbi:hypothetical protein OIU77_030508 [Salix suchowensis]|uniref:Uncharacterized protein n=1 Tax=Salix suchowensis TaxID=1278906 RepID=A0ABQ9BC73_9ROSI|nr:hypothetical protein OIU77_030508 [Salix suchowensis]
MLMKKLARNWKKISVGDKFTLPTRDEDDSRPMDSREQEELILSLERTEAEQSVLWRRVVGGLEFFYAAFLLYSTFQQALFPWELRYHAYFMEDMDSSMMIFAGLFMDVLDQSIVTKARSSLFLFEGQIGSLVVYFLCYISIDFTTVNIIKAML